MALVVNTNVGSLNAQRQLMNTTNEMQTAMERLSSGKRINGASDDAAGLAISERMTSQVRGLTMAVRNANDGISVTQTAEGALDEVTDMLQRMRELSVQASNATISDSDRSSLDSEVSQLLSEIDRVAETTRFNNMNILDGTFNANIQIGDQTDQNMGIAISNMSTSAMGEAVTGLGTEATAASYTTAGSSNSEDYLGRTLVVSDGSNTANIVLSESSSSSAVAAAVSGSVSVEDTGDATSRVISSRAYESNSVDLTTDTDRVFGIRVKDSSFRDIDITDALIAQLGLSSEAELEDATNYYANQVNKTNFLGALQSALDNELTGDYAVTVSVGQNGELEFFDVDGRSDTIALRAGAKNTAAGTFVSSFVHSEVTTNATMTNILGQGGASAVSLDFASTDNLSVFKAVVNGGTETTVDFLDKLNDASIVHDRSQMFAYELVNAIQAELDELFTGDDAVTVGFSDTAQALTFSVAGGDRTIVLSEGAYLNSTGTATSSTFVNDVIDDDATTTIDNRADAVDLNTAAVDLNDVSELFKYDHYGINVRVNGGVKTDIDLAFYLQDALSNPDDANVEELATALNNAFADHFTGDDAVTVSVDDTGRLNFDVAGGSQVLDIADVDFDNDGTFGTFGATFIDSGISGATAFTVNENLSGVTRFGDVVFGDYMAAGSNANTANSKTILTTSLNRYEADADNYESPAASGSRMQPFTVDDLNSTRSSITAQTTATGGITIDGSDDALTIALDDASAVTVTLDQGEYATMEAFAQSLQYEIDASGSFEGDNALTVAFESFTNGTSADTTADGAVSRLVISSAYGKKIEIGGELSTYTVNNGFALFGGELDSTVDDTTLFNELGVSPATTNYQTHNLIDGGIDTTVSSGIVTLAVTQNGNTFSHDLSLTQSANTSFDSFVSDLQTKANTAFAGNGISFTAANNGGAISLVMDQAGAADLSLSGTIIQNAFGSDLSGNGYDAGISAMADVVSSVNSQLSAANVDVTASYDETAETWTLATSATGSNASVSLSGSDTVQLGMTAGVAEGADGTATAAVLSSVSITSAEGASGALDSIDNALEYVNSQRASLGAIENRLTHTVNNLTNVIENTSAARSRIEDADYAVEAANLAKQQVMQQAGSAMLAQANAQAQIVLSLLG